MKKKATTLETLLGTTGISLFLPAWGGFSFLPAQLVLGLTFLLLSIGLFMVRFT
ncbi:MAG: hypothetical protein ABEJ72_00420 [Candidatus Aenigmatarchaeota archaeon]